MFKTIMVCNRSEITCRVTRTAKRTSLTSMAAEQCAMMEVAE